MAPNLDSETPEPAGYGRALAGFLAVAGPAIALYGLVRWRWPDPPQTHGAAGFGGGLLEEQRQRRLWLSRLAAVVFGIAHYVLLLSVT